MKKNMWKRVLTLGLSLMMTVSLCSCGKDGDDGNGGGGGIFGGGNKKDDAKVNAALAKEHVYRADYINLPETDSESNVADVICQDGKLLLFINQYNYNEETGYGSNKYYTITCDLDGSNSTKVELQLSESTDDTDPGNYDYYWENTYINYFMLTQDGNIYGIRNHSKEYSSTDEYSYTSNYSLCKWDTNGNLLQESTLDFLKPDSDSWINISSASLDENGDITLLIQGDQASINLIDNNGNLIKQTPIESEMESAFNNMERIIPMKNGNLYLLYHPETDWAKFCGAEFDVRTGIKKNSTEYPSSLLNNWDYNYMSITDDGDLIFTTNNGISILKKGAQEAEQMLDYINSDLMINSINNIVWVSSDSFIGTYRETGSDDYSVKVAKFTYVKPEDIQDKSVLVLAGRWIDYDVKKRVIEYNRTSQDSRIVVKDYSQYDSYDDYNAGITKLNNDIISGNMPDIIVADGYSSIPMESYVAKGLLADIGKLIADDEELSKEEYLQNVFDAYSINGKLYSVIPSFNASTYIAKQAWVGNKTSITMKEAQQIASQMGSDATVFETMTAENFLYNVMNFCGSRFVDTSTGTCDFNSQDFIDMLEFAKGLPQAIEYDDDYWMNYDWQKEQSKYRDNKVLMMYMSIYSFNDLSYCMNGYFGEPVSFIGFPTDSGKGSYISANQLFAVSAKSANLDKAWNFVRYYLTDEYQSSISYNLPVKKDCCLKLSKTAMERPYWTDENGEKQYYDQTMTINGEEVVIDPLNQQQVDQVLSFIETITNRYYADEDITNIVLEETGAFFQGQKSASDVAAVIQSRAQIYVDEKR